MSNIVRYAENDEVNGELAEAGVTEKARYFRKDDSFYRIRPVVSYMLERLTSKGWITIYSDFPKAEAEKQLKLMFGAARASLSSIEASETDALEAEIKMLEDACHNTTAGIRAGIKALNMRRADIVGKDTRE